LSIHASIATATSVSGKRRLILIALWLVCALLLSACGGEPVTPEEELQAVLEAGEQEVEARDLLAVMERVDADYRDEQQRDWRQLRALLAGYFFRHPNVYVISQVERIEIPQPGRAEVVLFAGLAGSAQEAAGPLSGLRGQLLRFDMSFRRVDADDWRLLNAAWRPVMREDLAE
jgi:hypothetical protein